MNKLRIKGTLTLCSTLALLTLASTNALADPVPTGEAPAQATVLTGDQQAATVDRQITVVNPVSGEKLSLRRLQLRRQVRTVLTPTFGRYISHRSTRDISHPSHLFLSPLLRRKPSLVTSKLPTGRSSRMIFEPILLPEYSSRISMVTESYQCFVSRSTKRELSRCPRLLRVGNTSTATSCRTLSSAMIIKTRSTSSW